jgi:hypothetical protein
VGDDEYAGRGRGDGDCDATLTAVDSIMEANPVGIGSGSDGSGGGSGGSGGARNTASTNSTTTTGPDTRPPPAPPASPLFLLRHYHHHLPHPDPQNSRLEADIEAGTKTDDNVATNIRRGGGRGRGEEEGQEHRYILAHPQPQRQRRPPLLYRVQGNDDGGFDRRLQYYNYNYNYNTLNNTLSPPSYFSPPSTPPTPHNFLTTYRTFGLRNSAMGTPDELLHNEQQQQPLLSSVEPESMGGHDCGRGDGGGVCSCGRGGGFWRRMATHRRTRGVRMVMFGLAAALVLGVVGLVMTHVHNKHHNRYNNHFHHQCPGHNPFPSERHDNGPFADPSLYDKELTWTPLQRCRALPEKRLPVHTFPVSFDGSRPLNLTQTITLPNVIATDDDPIAFMAYSQKNRLQHPQIWGDVVLRPVEGDAEPGVTVEIITNDVPIGVSWNEYAQSLEIVNDWIHWPDSSEGLPCVQMRITAWVPHNEEEASVERLIVNTVDLDISLLSGLDLAVVGGDASFRSLVGNSIQVAEHGVSLRSRNIHVNGVASDVRGPWPLYDTLEIDTASGDVDVSVVLKSANKDEPKPALLKVTSVSGTIDVVEPDIRDFVNQVQVQVQVQDQDQDEDDGDGDIGTFVWAIPPREYNVHIESTSGDISAFVAASSEASVRSVSGKVNLRMLPAWASDAEEGSALHLDTETKSGSVDVEVFDPLIVFFDMCECECVDMDVENEDENENEVGEEDLKIKKRLEEIFQRIIQKAFPEEGGVPCEDEEEDVETMVCIADGDDADSEMTLDECEDMLMDIDPDTTLGKFFLAIMSTPFHPLVARHASLSGALSIRYPNSWRGRFSAFSLSGAVDVRGEDVEIDTEGEMVGKKVTGGKGEDQDEGSTARLESMSGEVRLVIGGGE